MRKKKYSVPLDKWRTSGHFNEAYGHWTLAECSFCCSYQDSTTQETIISYFKTGKNGIYLCDKAHGRLKEQIWLLAKIYHICMSGVYVLWQVCIPSYESMGPIGSIVEHLKTKRRNAYPIRFIGIAGGKGSRPYNRVR